MVEPEPMQLGSSEYLRLSAGPIAVRAKCRRLARLLESDVRKHDSLASETALVTRPFPVMACLACQPFVAVYALR